MPDGRVDELEVDHWGTLNMGEKRKKSAQHLITYVQNQVSIIISIYIFTYKEFTT